jgi:hypothetical protein
MSEDFLFASEALRQTNELSKESFNLSVQLILGKIEEAIKNKDRKVSIPGTFTKGHEEAIKNFLTSKGYHVDYGSDQREGSWFNVSWEKPTR